MSEDTAALDRAQAWVDRYVAAWASNDPGDIAAAFADDASYRTLPYRPPWSGVEQITREWLDRRDETDDWTFRSEVVGIDGDRIFVQGVTEYPKESEVYDNLWVVDLADDGRARSFTEWWVLRDA